MGVMMRTKTVSQILLVLSLCLGGGCLGGESINTEQDIPIESPEYFEKGWDAFILGQYPEALDIWEQELARRDKHDPVPLAMVQHMAMTYAVWGQELKTNGNWEGAHRAFQRQGDLMILKGKAGDPSALSQAAESYLSGKARPDPQEEHQQYGTAAEKGEVQAQKWLMQAGEQGHGPARAHLVKVQTHMMESQKPQEVDGSTCLRDLVQVHLLEMTPWQSGEFQLEMQQGAAVHNLTDSFVMLNLGIHYSGSYTSNGSMHSPRYPVNVDKRPSLLLEPRAEATAWHFPVKGVYVWVPRAHWELTPQIDVAQSTCYLYQSPPAHWDADSHKLLKGEAAHTDSFDLPLHSNKRFTHSTPSIP